MDSQNYRTHGEPASQHLDDILIRQPSVGNRFGLILCLGAREASAQNRSEDRAQQDCFPKKSSTMPHLLFLVGTLNDSMHASLVTRPGRVNEPERASHWVRAALRLKRRSARNATPAPPETISPQTLSGVSTNLILIRSVSAGSGKII